MTRTTLIALLVAGSLTGIAGARQRRQADNTPGSFDYYLLNLSWAPEFCAAHAGNVSSSECDPAHHFGFIVHGLWPENSDGSYPRTAARPARLRSPLFSVCCRSCRIAVSFSTNGRDMEHARACRRRTISSRSRRHFGRCRFRGSIAILPVPSVRVRPRSSKNSRKPTTHPRARFASYAPGPKWMSKSA